MSGESANEFSISASVEVVLDATVAKATMTGTVGFGHSSTEARETTLSLAEGVDKTCEAVCAGKKGTRTTLWQYKRTLTAPKMKMHSSTCHYVCAYD